MQSNGDTCMLQEGPAALSGQAQGQLHVQCPLLHSFLLPHLQHAVLPPDVAALLRAVLLVRHAISSCENLHNLHLHSWDQLCAHPTALLCDTCC